MASAFILIWEAEMVAVRTVGHPVSLTVYSLRPTRTPLCFWKQPGRQDANLRAAESRISSALPSRWMCSRQTWEQWQTGLP
jgi:hypothetical protein